MRRSKSTAAPSPPVALMRAFARAVGIVVQPGVEFGNEDVIVYEPAKARALSAVLTAMPQFVFEAHSTDYQPPEALAALVGTVRHPQGRPGPDLRAARGALRSRPDRRGPRGTPRRRRAAAAMERLMVEKPGNWQKYYPARRTSCGCSGTSATPTASATTGRTRRPRGRCAELKNASPAGRSPRL